ncbi:MAG: hypothetical protein ABSH20_08425 [Tepidisphaeraceae bacterium]|jgi:hypothetical protein
MSEIQGLLAALDETTITHKVLKAHDQARARYGLRENTVGNFDEFARTIGHYYNYHFGRCISQGGILSSTESSGRAKELLEQHYRPQGGNIVSAYNDAHDGTHGGLRVILDVIAEGLKAESAERYTREAFDRFVAPHDWNRKVEIIRQFFRRCGANLSPWCDTENAERYAANFEELIRAYVNGLRKLSSMFRNI